MLQEIVEQFELCNYECKGGLLINNESFVKLKELAAQESIPLDAQVIILRAELKNLVGRTIITQKNGNNHIAYKVALVSERLDKAQLNALAEPEYKSYCDTFTIEEAKLKLANGELID
jgi:hypothetical protein